jgi:hypothetical protein
VMTGTHHHAQLFCWDGVFLIFCSHWPWNVILPISGVAGITGVGHRAWLYGSF